VVVGVEVPEPEEDEAEDVENFSAAFGAPT
jgi:hypothetical protein